MEGRSAELVTITAEPYNAETPRSVLLAELTPRELVYVRNHFETPRIELENWSLEVCGSAAEPVEFSYRNLQQQPPKTLRVALECAGNGRNRMHPVPAGTPWGYGAVSIVEFTGTSLRHVLDGAEIPDGAVELAFEGTDRGEVEPGRIESFARSLPLDLALDPDTLVAWDMNGRPLSPEHGFPLRLVVPGWYGMASVKWLRRVTPLAAPFRGYFQSERYVYLEEQGTSDGEPVRRIRPRSLIVTPGANEELEAGQAVEVAGIAWSGRRAVVQVEFSADGGASWTTADLEPPHSPYAVQNWTYRWTPPGRGHHRLVSRATDSDGNAQPQSQRWNRLGYGNNGPQEVVVVVRSYP